MTTAPSASLQEALERRELQLPAGQVEQLDRYCRILWRWNEQLNLTRHTNYDLFVSRDLADSCALTALLADREEVLDVGSGGGVPGVVIAILRPDLDVTLCESMQKKARVLEAIVKEMKLRTAVHHKRSEQLLEDLRYDSLVARAVGPLWKILTWFEPHWASIGRLLLIKGPKWVEERAEARQRNLLQRLELRKVASYPLENTYSESVILQLTYRRES